MPGPESVWDYPRPPRLELAKPRIRVVFQGVTIADSMRCYRILETSHPPTYYLPPQDIHPESLVPGSGQSFCEYKGAARYWSIRAGGRLSENAAWSYPSPSKGYEAIKDYLAFYANRVDACFVDDEQVQPQPGDFYGGWVTSGVIGPFKGAPGTMGW